MTLSPTSSRASAAAGGIGWVTWLTETGASFANWNAVTGTWSSTGSVIQQTDATVATARRAGLTTVCPALFVAQIEFMIPSAGAPAVQADQHLGLLMGVASNAPGSGSNVVRAVAANNVGNVGSIEADGVGSRITTNINWTYFDTWNTLRAIYDGQMMTGWLNGTLIGTAGSLSDNNTPQNLGLITFNVKAQFRNLHVWAPDIASIVLVA